MPNWLGIALLQAGALAAATAVDPTVTAETVHSIEMVGGGTRIPFVRAAILEVVSEDKLTHTLDGAASVALGVGSQSTAALLFLWCLQVFAGKWG
jgi:molecular chaperone DnaK (HSP70)